MLYLRRGRRLLNKVRHVGKDAIKIQFLLIAGGAGGGFRLAGDRQHRRMVKFGIIQAGQQMGGAGAAGREADAQLAGEFGMARRHKRRHLFMAHLNKFDARALFIGALDGPQDAVNAVAGVAVNAGYAPRFQALHEKIAGLHCHRLSLPLRLHRL